MQNPGNPPPPAPQGTPQVVIPPAQPKIKAGGPLDRLMKTPGLDGWIVTSSRTIRHELYFQGDQTESRRHVESLGGNITVFTRDGDRLGRADFDILGGHPEEFDAQLTKAIAASKLGNEKPFPLPERAADYPKVYLLDPEVRDHQEAIPSKIRAAILEGAGREPKAKLAMAEAFVSKTSTAIGNNHEAGAENDESLYNIELAFLAGEGAAQQERQARWRRRRFEDLDLANQVAIEAGHAVARVGATLPKGGLTPVILSPALIGGLVAWLVRSTSAQSVYRKETPLEIGKPIGPKGSGGDPLIVELDALFPFGPNSYRIDALGTAGTNVRVIDNGVFARPHADAQYAHYLGLDKATGAPGTPQLKPGKDPEATLRRDSYLEVISVSDLIPQASTGRFSAEIRMGYEVTGGTRKPITGGTLTGNVAEVLAHARWSKEISLQTAYVGPNILRIETGCSVVV